MTPPKARTTTPKTTRARTTAKTGTSTKRTKRQREEDLRRAGQRRARRAPCRRCGRPVLFGLDADVMAFDVIVETWSATPADEVVARAAGRWSFTLRPFGEGEELDRRDRVHVLRSPGVSTWGGRVVLAHVCGSPTRPDPEPETALYDPDAPPPF